ncbi:hypothetical protein CSB20_12760 [bacterium DOLZORAL124_64_63]|nr:MAG: hypothetical protein CSB20_12760 [bacterium DOLZORAL124_64_63]
MFCHIDRQWSPLPLMVAALVMVGIGSAEARTRPNVEGRLVQDVLHGSFPGMADVAVDRSAPAPLPDGAHLLGETYYDLQDMGSLGSRIVWAPDGTLHVVFMEDFCEEDPVVGCPPDLSLPNPYPMRGMALYTRDTDGVWSDARRAADPSIRDCCVTEIFGGFGTLGLTNDGRAMVAQHMNEDGCDLRGDLYIQKTQGSTEFDAYLGEITPDSYLFPQVTANPDGSYTLFGEIAEYGSYNEVDHFRLAYLPAEGEEFVCPTGWQFSSWKSVESAVPRSLFQDGTPAFPSMAGAEDGRVGVAFGDFGGNVFLLESSDGTFEPNTLTLTEITSYQESDIVSGDETSQEYRSYVNCDLAYNGNEAHVVWSEMQARNEGGTIYFYDYRSRIMHWSPSSGISVVRQVQPGEADQFANLDGDLPGPMAGFNHISVSWPQVGFNESGTQTIVAWLRFVDAEVDPSADGGSPGIVTGVGYGDIVGSVSSDGMSWSEQQNFTQTPTTDERFFSLADINPEGKVLLAFQASATDQAGCAAIGDRGATPGNLVRNLAFLERDLDSSVAAAPGMALNGPRLAVSPNPSGGSMRFALTGAEDQTLGHVAIYSVRGVLVSEFDLRGGYATWNMLNALGEPVPAGVYFAKVRSPQGTATRKIVVVR